MQSTSWETENPFCSPLLRASVRIRCTVDEAHYTAHDGSLQVNTEYQTNKNLTKAIIHDRLVVQKYRKVRYLR